MSDAERLEARVRRHDAAPRRREDVLRDATGAAVHAGVRPRARPRPRPRLPGGVPDDARRLPQHVPRPPVDDAAVRGLRLARGDERALPLPAGAGPDRLVGRVRPAHADGPRLRRPVLARRGRTLRGRHRFPRRLRAALRPDPAGRHHDLDDDQRPSGDRVRDVPGRRRAPGRPVVRARRHVADRHLQGVHRPARMALPAPAPPAAHRRSHDVLRAGGAALPPDQRLRLPHPRGGLDRGAGTGVHPRRRVRLRGARDGARPRRRRLRPTAVVLLQRAHRLLRGDREVPRRPPDVGDAPARPLRGEGRPLAAPSVPHPNGRVLAHRRATREQHRANRVRSPRGRDGRHAIAPHEFARRGLRAARPTAR